MATKKQVLEGKHSKEEDDEEVEISDAGSSSQEEEVAPKYAQYIDSDEAEADEDSDISESSEEEEASLGEEEARDPEDIQEKQIRKKMESIPFSSLVRAQKSMKGGGAGERETDEDDSEEDEFEAERKDSGSEKIKRGSRSMYDLQKRDNKHAPTELSSRKPVSRKRAVVETQNNVLRRDPRFSSLSASLPNAGLFQSSYGFLREQQTSETKELKAAFNKLKRQEANHAGPRAKSELAQSIQRERQQVELALKRAEGRENERRVREREQKVIRKEKKAIEERVKQGGKPFYLKESAKKQLVLKDKFDRLSGAKEDDGSGVARKDLKRAIERRRKKNAAKERRSMPLGGGSTSQPGSTAIPKRKRLALSDHDDRKRIKQG